MMRYFSVKEMIRCYREDSGDRCAGCRLTQPVRNMPNGIDDNIRALVTDVLDPAREVLGMPIVVNSGFRCPLHNARVGGVQNSQHTRGEAADIRCADNSRLAEIIIRNGRYDQLIIYPTFLHVSWKRVGGNRRQVIKK